MKDDQPKPIRWIGSSRKDVRSFPQRVRLDIGKALFAPQSGELDPAAKALRGFGGADVMGNRCTVCRRHMADCLYSSL